MATSPSQRIPRIWANTGRKVVVHEGNWKLVVTYRKTTTFALFDSKMDPDNKNDLSVRLGQIVFRLRGLLEKKEGRTKAQRH